MIPLSLHPNLRLILLFGLSISTFAAKAAEPSWEVVSRLGNSQLEINISTVTKIQNSLVFDSFNTINVQNAKSFRTMDRYIVSCNGINAAPLSGMPWGRGTDAERVRWLDEKNVSVLDATENLVIDTAFTSDYWFSTPSFRKKIQALCSSSRKGLKNIEASVASGKENDGSTTTYVVLLDTYKFSPKYREVWQANYKAKEVPITYTDSSTGEVKQVELFGKLQTQRNVIGTAQIRARKRYDCENRKSATAQYVSYTQSGQVLESKSFNEAEIGQSWTEVVPRSIGEALIDFVCAL